MSASSFARDLITPTNVDDPQNAVEWSDEMSEPMADELAALERAKKYLDEHPEFVALLDEEREKMLAEQQEQRAIRDAKSTYAELEAANAELTAQLAAVTRERDAAQTQLEAQRAATSTALWYMGVDPNDWTMDVRGVESAAQSNLFIGGAHFINRDAWGDVPEGTLTDFIFGLIEAQDKTNGHEYHLPPAI